MYTLYFSPGACSLATQIILRELGQEPELIDRTSVDNFLKINPTNAVPTILDGSRLLTEGVAILLHLLEKHDNTLLPKAGEARDRAMEAMLFANATMHPAYGRLFFASQNIKDEAVQKAFFDKAAGVINSLWAIVNEQIGSNDYVVGNQFSPADALLTVYAAWGQFFPVDIKLGENTERMIKNVQARPSFIKSREAEAANAAS